MLVIEPVVERRALERFLRLPWQIYADYPCWVPPLLIERRQFFDPARNPFFAHAEVQLFLARRDQQDVGTIAAFINHNHNRFHKDRVGFFGFFEVFHDSEAAEALLQTAAAWLRQRGMTVMRGPCNFAADNESGILLDAFDQPPVIMTVYTPPYYRSLLEAAGFGKAMDWYAYAIDRTMIGETGDTLPRPILRGLDAAPRRQGIQVRKMHRRTFAQELRLVQQIYNCSWEKNWGFVPLDDAEIDYLAAGLKWIIDPDLVWIAEKDGRPVGVSISLPDLNQLLRQFNGRLLPLNWIRLLRQRPAIDTLRFFALGIIPEYRRRGLEMVFYYHTVHEALRKGYQRAELSLVAETSTMVRRSIESLGARINKTYRIFERSLM